MYRRRLGRAALARLAAFAPLCAVSVTLTAGSAFARPSKTHEGDILHIFDNARVYVVTNGDTSLADALLANCGVRERRILTPAEWDAMPPGVRDFVSTVFLIDREMLPAKQTVPENCPAGGDTVFTGVERSGHPNGVTYAVTLSAPDAADLRDAVGDFRRLSEPPRHPITVNVRPLAIVPLTGREAALAADMVAHPRGDRPPHVLPAADYARASDAGRLADADEVVLIDRSAPPADPAVADAPTADGLSAGRTIAAGDAVVWRERKPDGHARIVYSAPNVDLLAEAVHRCPNPLSAPDEQTVLVTARDLRAVRRIAVAGVRTGAGGADLARRLASRAATGLRTLDSFEVLERSGLSEVLAEVALGQAGITQANDRAKLRQMAAADALLVVEVTDATGGTEYAAKCERETPPMAGPPRKPSEPSRVRFTFPVRGKEDDSAVQAAVDSVMVKVAGAKTDREYRTDLNQYNNETLPAYQHALNDYNRERARRTIKWTETVTARSTATVTGSLRLVDLADGMVLWEQPFSATDSADRAVRNETVFSHGENSAADSGDPPAAESAPPAELLSRVAESALENGLRTLRGTAILPATGAAAPVTVAPTVATPVRGRVLDIDGDSVLVGLGATDGIRLGDALTVTLPGGASTAVVVTRVRPRTCDCEFGKAAPAALRAKIAANLGAAAVERR
jgi:hypothetical protein